MNNRLLQNTNVVVKAAFMFILILVMIFGIFSLYQLKIISQNMTNAVDTNNKKIGHVILMRDAIRQRQLLMTEMLLVTDAFRREKSRIAFFEAAGLFRIERSALLLLPNNKSETELLNKITKHIQMAQDTNRSAIDYLMEYSNSKKGRTLILRAQTSQKNVYNLLGDLIALQNNNIEEFVRESKEQYSSTLLLSVLFGFVIALFAWGIARVVSKILTEKNNELLIKNKQLEKVSAQALEATRIKSEFLAVMSHEIRTPLTSIIGFAEALAEPSNQIEDRQSITKIIIKNGKHLLKIINDILDISKIEANRMEFENIYFSPVDLVTDVEETIKNQYMEKGIQFYIEYNFPIPNVICNDMLRIKQIILNLCSNALKFTQAGKVSIKIHCNIDDEKIFFTVIDSGIGLTEEQISKVFDAFSQADSSTTRKYGGTGLGLSLSKQFAEKMGGTITVESLIGIGSQFCVSINTGNINKQQLIVGTPELPEKSDHIKYHFDYTYTVKGNILIAEDNHENQQLLSILLSDIGAKINFVENGQQVLDKALNSSYDLIFMDMQMPIMGGLEAVKILRDNNYKNPIIALTANAMKSDYDMCIKAGCDDFLTKPIVKEKLFHMVYRYLEIDSNESKGDMKNNKSRSAKLQALSKIFIDGLPERLSFIEQARNQKNWKNMKDELHKIKGVGTSMGYPNITKSAAELEYEVIRENEVEIDKLFFNMKSLCEEIKNNLAD